MYLVRKFSLASWMKSVERILADVAYGLNNFVYVHKTQQSDIIN